MPTHSGTVSHGTMRYVDLIPTFWRYLHAHNQDVLATLVRDGYYDLYCDIVDADSDMDLDDDELEAASHLLVTLFDAMDDLAPEHYYFGAHPGDGSDYGFWEVTQ